MIPASFNYLEATSVDHAVALLAEHGESAKLLAGGHTLIPIMRFRMSTPELLIDIARIKALRGITVEADGIRIGATTTHAEVADDPNVARHFPLMVEAVSVLADPLIRNRGTLGGSIANADPTADWTAVLLALDAEIEVQGVSGRRTIPISLFFDGLFSTALQPGEVLTAIRVRFLPRGSKCVYEKIRHPASGYALCGIACVWSQVDGVCTSCRIGGTGIGPVPYRAVHFEALLQGRSFDAELVEQNAHLITHGVDVMSDAFYSAEYKQALAAVTVKRALLRVNDLATKEANHG